jgi:hypothetical protein
MSVLKISLFVREILGKFWKLIEQPLQKMKFFANEFEKPVIALAAGVKIPLLKNYSNVSISWEWKSLTI